MTYSTPGGYETALNNELEVGTWLHRFGWLTSDQVGRLIWPNGSQSRRMAQRTLKRMLERGSVLRRKFKYGGYMHVLSEPGARWLRENGVGANNRGGRDLRYSHPAHRMLCNELAIHEMQNGLDVWTEYEIKRKRAPFHKLKGHIPDLLSVDNIGRMTWYEVENSYKSADRLDNLLSLADTLVDSLYGHPIGESHIQKFCFITPNRHTYAATKKAFIEHENIGFTAAQRTVLRPCRVSRRYRIIELGEEDAVVQICYQHDK